MTFNTGNPIGSTDARDLHDNAQNFDKLSVGPERSYPDRLGVFRKSWAGMEADFADFLAASGFEPEVLQYVDGSSLTVDRPTQLIERAATPGILYAIKLPSAFPVTLSGTWATDEAKLVIRVDDSLRQELANGTEFLVDTAVVGSGGQSLELLLADLTSATVLQDGTGADIPVADALFQILTRDRINAAWYGFKATRTPAEQSAALAAAAAQAKIEGTRLYIPKDDYQLAAGVKIEVPVTMDGGSLDFSSGVAADFSATTSNGLLITGGGYTQLPNLAADAAKYSGSISFVSAPSLSPGDVICIYNPTDSSWSGFRVDYRAGEFATVLRVDGTTVYLAGLLYESYTAGSVAIYKMNRLSGDFDFGGAEIIGPNPAIAVGAGVRFQNIVRSSIYGLTARNANYLQIGVWQSVDVDVYGCNAMTLENTLNGTQYGLSLANTQSVRVHGGTFVSERHGVTMGGASGLGAVVTRDCHVYGAHITTRGDFAADFHGNVEHSSYEGCTLVGGATFGGNKNAYKNNKLITGGLGYGFFASEPKGTDFEFTGSEIEARTVAPSGRGVFDCIAITSNTVLGGTLSIKDMRIYGADQPDAFGANIRNYGSTAVGRRVNIDGLHIETPSAIAPCRLSTQSGTDWSSLTMGVVTSTGDETLTYISGVTTKRRMTLAAF